MLHLYSFYDNYDHPDVHLDQNDHTNYHPGDNLYSSFDQQNLKEIKICYSESKHFIEKTATLEFLGLKEYVSGWAALPSLRPLPCRVK